MMTELESIPPPLSRKTNIKKEEGTRRGSPSSLSSSSSSSSLSNSGDRRTFFDSVLAPDWTQSPPPAPYSDTLNPQNRMETIHETLRSTCLFIIALVSIGIALVYLEYVLVALILARGIVKIFEPLLKFLMGARRSPGKWNCCLPRGLAIAVVFLLIFSIIALLCVISFFSIRSIMQNTELYLTRFEELNDEIVEFIMTFGYSKENAEELIPNFEVKDFIVPVIQFLYYFFPTAVLIIVLVLYMVASYDPTVIKSEARRDIEDRIRKYILIHSIISLFTGFITGVILLIFQSELWMVLGLFSFLFNYIPNIGSVLAVLLPTLFQIFDPNVGWPLAILTFFSLGFVQFILGQIVEPRILGKVLDVPAITILASLLFWGSIWGIVGCIMSVPITVSIKLYLETIDHPLTIFLAGAIVGEFRSFSSNSPRSPPSSPSPSPRPSSDPIRVASPEGIMPSSSPSGPPSFKVSPEENSSMVSMYAVASPSPSPRRENHPPHEHFDIYDGGRHLDLTPAKFDPPDH